jgi:probable rRNA maturation factor
MGRRTRLHVNLSTPDRSIPASRGLAAWLADIAPARARGEVTVALVSDRRMRVLNRAFRGKDYTTDVLSFPIGADPAEMPAVPAGLGDIVIASGVAERQAREHGHAVGTELRLLALHGLLHLLGYDHDHPSDEGRMARTEARLRAKAGLPSGVIARAAGRTRGGRPAATSPGGTSRRS